MARWSVLAAAAVAVLVGGVSVASDAQPAEAKPAAGEPKVGVFHMPRVMREYQWAARQLKPIEDRRTRMTTNLVAWRTRYNEIFRHLETACLVHPREKDKWVNELLALAQKHDVEDVKVNALLTEAAALLAAEVQERIREEVAVLAKERGLIAIHSHPFTSEDVLNPPGIKQLKLKPPGPQPFYVHRIVDYTDELIQRLNAKFAADGGKD